MFHRVWETFHQKTVPKTSYNLDTFVCLGVLASPVRRRYRGSSSISAKTCHAKITA